MSADGSNPVNLTHHEGRDTRPHWIDQGARISFLSNRDDYEADQPAFTLYHWRTGTDAVTPLATERSDGIPDGWWVGEHGEVSFSKAGTRLFFGTAPRPEPEADDDEVLDDDKVVVDIWNWKDPLLHPGESHDICFRYGRLEVARATSASPSLVTVTLGANAVANCTIRSSAKWATAR